MEDDPHTPHSDHAIEEALRPFDVEFLDWNKPDLDPEMLFSACPNVTDLVLHWGGNNAILRAWSEADGLRKLTKLETVTIIRTKVGENKGVASDLR